MTPPQQNYPQVLKTDTGPRILAIGISEALRVYWRTLRDAILERVGKGLNIPNTEEAKDVYALLALEEGGEVFVRALRDDQGYPFYSEDAHVVKVWRNLAEVVKDPEIAPKVWELVYCMEFPPYHPPLPEPFLSEMQDKDVWERKQKIVRDQCAVSAWELRRYAEEHNRKDILMWLVEFTQFVLQEMYRRMESWENFSSSIVRDLKRRS